MEQLVPQLEKLGIQYERHSAVDGKELGINPIFAGTMSHVEVLKNNRDSKILVLEDDAQFVDNFNEKFEEVMQTLPNDSDIFYLGAVLLNSEHCNQMMVRAMDTSSLHAYCINPKFKDKALAQARTYPEHIDVAYRLIHRQCRAYAAKHALVKQFPSYSDLMLKDVDYLSWYK